MSHNEDVTPVKMCTCTVDVDVQRYCVVVLPKEDAGSGSGGGGGGGGDGSRTLNAFVKLNPNPVLAKKGMPGLLGLGKIYDPTNLWTSPVNSLGWVSAFVASINSSYRSVPDERVVLFTTADLNW
ncbi:beta-fructofuranosidase-like protein [Trypanosoma grayi]|uniref:beta-fructofuranosidase-like protein n=1 Tax=Trypanosoma grayi TaxID=71804 RepID=UPI0004F4B99D|nr:beta-fructofuranosidase-like protein [Trypanosoma grayi]KEG08863.1 beta-fructofuranosidase-like protein [Trypanosoma grayi]